jgi:hypothetical protein
MIDHTVPFLEISPKPPFPRLKKRADKNNEEGGENQNERTNIVELNQPKCSVRLLPHPAKPSETQ